MKTSEGGAMMQEYNVCELDNMIYRLYYIAVITLRPEYEYDNGVLSRPTDSISTDERVECVEAFGNYIMVVWDEDE
jgi:hypothetical protein